MPSAPRDAKGLLKSAIRDNDPVIFIEHKLLYGEKGPVPEGEYLIPLGKAEVKREGKDVTLVATSRMVLRTLQAAQRLEAEGVSCEVVDPRTLFPLDREAILNSVKKTHRLAIVHEAVKRCGWGAEVAAMVAEEALDYLDAPIQRIAALETPVPFAPNLEDFVIPNVDRIVKGVKALVG
jgi:pyruvate dehydrogenase E1 component beta subunit